MDYSDYDVVAQNQETNVICVRAGFLQGTIIVIEPETWPEDLPAWLDEHIQKTFNKDASNSPVAEPTEAEAI